MDSFWTLVVLNLRWIVRDRIAQALLGIALALLVLVPVFSSFSMRQAQEISVNLALSSISLVLLGFSVFLGSTLLWREIERRYTFAVLALPISRSRYVLAKFLAIALFLLAGAVLLGACSSLAIHLGEMQYASDFPVQWGRVAISIGGDVMKFTLLAAIALALSTLSTSFFMPFFITLSIYLAGSASQGVYEYIYSSYGERFTGWAKGLITFVYYLIPNFSVFDFKLQAIYPIEFDYYGLAFSCGYFLAYTSAVLCLSVMVFDKREML